MEIELTDRAKKDLEWLKKTGNKSLKKKIELLLRAISDDPYDGIGKVEELKYNLSGHLSRRINLEHRIVYRVDEENDIIYINSMRGHY